MRHALYTAALAAAALAVAPAAAQDSDYEVPHNAFGQPDVSGFWSNVSITPMTRSRDLGDRLVYTEEEVAEIEGRVQVELEEANAPTAPGADAEHRNPTTVTRPEFQAAGGAVGGYNRFWLNAGDKVMRVNGEPRTSIVTTSDGQIPARIEGAPRGGFGRGGGGQRGYVGYETRSYSDRCIVGFGRNMGPPMLNNGFYNNNYHIVQTPDHVMILTEMIHDNRVVRLNAEHRADDVRPWFGDSIGWYDGDTLVVETTHIPERQALYGAWENLTITERFTRVGEDAVLYQFTIEDPTVWEDAWGGEYEFHPLGDVIYEYACHEGNYALPGILRASIADAEARDAASASEEGE